MQFHLRSLLLVMVAVSLLCGVVFAAPPIVALPILCTILWVCPALWVNGIIYGREAWRPFFIGGLMAGLAPHMGALYYSIVVWATVLEGNSLAAILETGAAFENLLSAAILLAPGLFAFLGGIVGVCVYWTFQPPKVERAAESPVASDYVVVSGRLTTTPVERQQI